MSTTSKKRKKSRLTLVNSNAHAADSSEAHRAPNQTVSSVTASQKVLQSEWSRQKTLGQPMTRSNVSPAQQRAQAPQQVPQRRRSLSRGHTTRITPSQLNQQSHTQMQAKHTNR